MLPQFVHSQCFARQTALPKSRARRQFVDQRDPEGLLRNKLSTAEYEQ
jgi:hypothetical protein